MKSKLQDVVQWYVERHVFWFLIGLLGLNGIAYPVPYFGIVSVPATALLLYQRYWREDR